MMPEVSICIPAYNQTHYLRKTLESILIQTFQDFEIIITDDSTSPLVNDLVKEYNLQEKIRYYQNEIPLGPTKNWNYSISKARGKYIKIMHHDDWFNEKTSLCRFIEALKNTGASMAFSDATVLYEKSQLSRLHTPHPIKLVHLAKNPSILFLGNFIGGPSSIIFKRDDNFKFDENLKWLVDIDFYIRYLKEHSEFCYINENLVTILTDSDTTLTSECVGDQDIVLYESFYVFNKISTKLGYREFLNFSDSLFQLLQQYGINSFKDVSSNGYEEFIPKNLFFLYLIKKQTQKWKRIFNRIFK